MIFKVGDNVKSTPHGGHYIPGTSKKEYPLGVIVGIYPENNEVLIKWTTGRYKGWTTGENLAENNFTHTNNGEHGNE